MTKTRTRRPKALSIGGVRYPVIDNLGYLPRLTVHAVVIEVKGEDRMAYRRKGESEWRIWERPIEKGEDRCES